MIIEMYDKKITLDKCIYITLDNSLKLFEMFPEIFNDDGYFYAGSLDLLCKAIKERNKCIITPITHVLNSSIMELGYDFVIQNGLDFIRFSELVGGYNEEKSFNREIRFSQNWEKMLYSGCFNIEVPQWWK